MRFIIVVLLCFTVNAVFSQKIILSARVKDSATGEALSYASVGIKGKPIGTITNLQGDFDFHFPNEYRNEILVISMLGYRNFEAPVWSLLDDGITTILMDKSVFLLEEVVISDSLTGGEILKIAFERIEQNYPMKPFMLDGFYRDIKKVGGTYIALLEAAVKVYDENYEEPRNKSKLRERVKLIEVRKSLGYESRFTTYFDQHNLLEDLLLHNNIRYRQLETSDEFLATIKREPDTYYDNHQVYVVSHTQDFFLKIFIDKQDYSIIHLEFENNSFGENLGKRKNMVSKYIGYKQAIDFKRHAGKMYLNYITVTSKEDWHDRETDELKFRTELTQYFMVNQVHTDIKQRIGATEKMRNYGLQYQDYPYNKSFWDNYNVIKETPLDKKILEDLEKLAPLEKQFEN